LNLPLTELRRSPKTEKPRNIPGGSPALEQKTAVAPELDFRGLRVEEALEKVDKYLDTAYLAGLASVSLIHGKGTGVLREAIRNYLAKHPFVASYRSGGYYEGGTGVTIVEFK
jgi:DNA mismatch repair protein MutS2